MVFRVIFFLNIQTIHICLFSKVSQLPLGQFEVEGEIDNSKKCRKKISSILTFENPIFGVEFCNPLSKRLKAGNEKRIKND